MSRNAASSRAIPVKTLIARTLENLAKPLYWGKNQKGMQPGEELSKEIIEEAEATWLSAAEVAVGHATKLAELGVHKQCVNRLLEPFVHMETVVSATEWSNFFNLRCDEAAQQEFQFLAYLMFEERERSTPQALQCGDWHIPFDGSYLPSHTTEEKLKIATARAARLSYLTHDKKAISYEDDFRLHDDLVDGGHWSPFEHPAQVMEEDEFYGNFRGYKQYRKFFPHENRNTLDVDSIRRKMSRWLKK